VKELLSKYRGALFFILVFVILYLGLNSIYGLYIESHYPQVDPFTWLVSNHTIAILGLFYDNIQITLLDHSEMIPVFINDKAVLDIFEGCNSLNVMIVYVSFIIAFKGPLQKTIYYILGGMLAIYIMNILRLALLIESTQSFPDFFYYFHKYIFTASIYVIVFILWYFWTRQVSLSRSGE
jgi:exosortase family protein XrtF